MEGYVKTVDDWAEGLVMRSLMLNREGDAVESHMLVTQALEIAPGNDDRVAIYGKLNVNNRTKAIAAACQRQIL